MITMIIVLLLAIELPMINKVYILYFSIRLFIKMRVPNELMKAQRDKRRKCEA